MSLKKFTLKEFMHAPLPSLTDQRKKLYRPTKREVKHFYKLINQDIFKNKLTMPTIELVSHRKYLGLCQGKNRWGKPYDTGSYCTIKLIDKFYCRQWFITTLAHEMVHQYQWDILSGKRRKQGKSPIMSHGPSFYVWKTKLNKFSIPLKKHFKLHKWFQYQQLDKC
jgi:hypothetical protein